MKLDITQLRKMILEEAQKMSPTGRKNLQEVFRSAGGIGFGDMKPLVQDAPQQPLQQMTKPTSAELATVCTSPCSHTGRVVIF